MIKRLRAFWAGRIYVVGRGKNPAAFLNEILRDGIELFNTQRSETGIKAQVGLTDFRRMRRAARVSHTRIRVVSRYGWPFILARWWRRKGLLAGLFLIAGTILLLSQMILLVSVSGNKNISAQHILDQAAQGGLKAWVWQRDVDLNEVADDLKNEMPDAAWIGIQRQGVRVVIRIVEKVRPQIPAAAGDLVAVKDGLIQDIMVIQGVLLVHEGETIQKGRTLIVRDWNNVAKGFIRGRVWYSAEADVLEQEDKMEESGRSAEGWGIKIAARVIMVTMPQSPFSDVREEEQRYLGWQWRNWRFPVEVIHIQYFERQVVHWERTAEEAQKAAETQARAEVYAKLEAGAKVVEEKVKILNGVAGARKVRIEVETYEDLAVYADA
ncbi:MAG: sporulation protein YqfD [Peptococcaceae bacterium]|jgi:similar to stage IV sporulation protein|nr:sporulation protein YqfD [Peptococcaceae bacterium]